MSVNAGSEQEHYQEYHIEPQGGLSSWQVIKHNALLYLKSIHEIKTKTTFGFSFVLLGNEPVSSYIGMAKFIKDIHEASNGLPLFAHFRPKFIYYYDNGIAVPEVTDQVAQNIANISKMVDKYVLPNLPKSHTLTIQKNIHAISYAGKNAKAKSCFSTGWATSFNHLGEGYILSELCGSKWDGSCWGDLRKQSMLAAWSSTTRLQLYHEYADGVRKAPIYNKLTGLHDFLSSIRKAIKTPMADQEIEEFWHIVDRSNYMRPESWDFI